MRHDSLFKLTLHEHRGLSATVAGLLGETGRFLSNSFTCILLGPQALDSKMGNEINITT